VRASVSFNDSQGAAAELCVLPVARETVGRRAPEDYPHQRHGDPVDAVESREAPFVPDRDRERDDDAGEHAPAVDARLATQHGSEGANQRAAGAESAHVEGERPNVARPERREAAAAEQEYRDPCDADADQQEAGAEPEKGAESDAPGE
jgi:hypothetical protein